MRERSVLASLALVLAANGLVLWMLGAAALDHRLSLGALVAYASAAAGTSMIAFGGLNWALDGAAAPVAAVARLKAAMGQAGTITERAHGPADGMPASQITFRDVTFAYPAAPGPPRAAAGFSLEIPAGSSLAIVGQNGAGKTTLAKLLCRLYDPQSGAIEVDGTDLRDLDLESWRRRVTAVFQDFVRFELTLGRTCAPRQTAGRTLRPAGALDDTISAALAEAGATGLAGLDTLLAKGYAGGTDLSGGQWQRVALARALAAVRLGAGLVLLDEPTAQLDVRGETEIFERILAATRSCTTILISHRFSTVRHVDRIAVVEDGAVVELGSHDELMALRGRYWRMFSLQAQRFAAGTPEEGEEEVTFDVLS